MAIKRLDDQIKFTAKTPLFDNLNRMLSLIEVRLQGFEETRADYEAVTRRLESVALSRINDLLLPAAERLIGMTGGFLVARSATENTLEADHEKLFVINEGPSREYFTPTPFVAIQREQTLADYAVAYVLRYDRETGSLTVRITTAYGAPGPWSDWVISASPGVSEATKTYFERAGEAAQETEANATQVAADRAYVQEASAALQEAGLDPNQYVWRNGSRAFTAVAHGIAPPSSANDDTLPTSAWARARFGDFLSYGAIGNQIIEPSGFRKGLVFKAGSFVRLDIPGQPGEQFVWSLSSDMVIADAQQFLDVGNSFLFGKDYFIYLVLAPDNDSAFVMFSLNTTCPEGATIENSRKIGGFHTLCVSAGSGRSYTRGDQVVDHDLNGFIAGDILPLSIWDLVHRQRQDRSPPPGMVYEKYLGIWGDIYGQSGTGLSTKSAYQGTITRSRQYVDFVEDMGCVGKILLSDEEYAMLALGSPEQVNVAGGDENSATVGGAGGRVATNGQRILSYCGCEEMVGCLWSYLRTTSAAGILGAIYGQRPDGSYDWLSRNPFGFANMGESTPEPMPQAGGKGGMWGVAGALLAGGDWHHGSGCGSRARHAFYSRSSADVGSGGRGRVPN